MDETSISMAGNDVLRKQARDQVFNVNTNSFNTSQTFDDLLRQTTSAYSGWIVPQSNHETMDTSAIGFHWNNAPAPYGPFDHTSFTNWSSPNGSTFFGNNNVPRVGVPSTLAFSNPNAPYNMLPQALPPVITSHASSNTLVSPSVPYSALSQAPFLPSATQSTSNVFVIPGSASIAAPASNPMKPYACSVCSKPFARKGDMERHLRSHGPYLFHCSMPECRYFGKGFHRKDKYDLHCEKHTSA